MKTNLAYFVVPLILLSSAVGAGAATTAGPSALALAALVAGHSPALPAAQKQEMARLLDGNLQGIPANPGNIAVQADSVLCRASNVDITARSCTLAFGAMTVTLKGRQANELGATIEEAGVSPQGAAGTIYEGLKHLACSIAPGVIRMKAGGGANCSYQTY
ncbi:MAG: hypothetical protein WAN59_02940 [Candidatus Baltobacteraceae bacterium]|jgi:uncharacterized Zn-binding protein involved in type VI secretion